MAKPLPPPLLVAGPLKKDRFFAACLRIDTILSFISDPYLSWFSGNTFRAAKFSSHKKCGHCHQVIINLEKNYSITSLQLYHYYIVFLVKSHKKWFILQSCQDYLRFWKQRFFPLENGGNPKYILLAEERTLALLLIFGSGRILSLHIHWSKLNVFFFDFCNTKFQQWMRYSWRKEIFNFRHFVVILILKKRKSRTQTIFFFFF